MKTNLQKLSRIFKPALVVCFSCLFILIGDVRADVIVSEEFVWQYQSAAAHSCQTYKATLKGPGIVTVETKMNPLRFRDFAMSREDILTHSLGYFAESLGQTINGIQNADSKDFEGKSVDRISRWKIPAKTFNAEFKVCNPVKCNLAGDCSQQQAVAKILIDYAASSPVSTGDASSSTENSTELSNQANILGTWIRTAEGKVIDRMDITILGDGYKIELREGDNAPLYASGFGVLQGNTLVGATRNTSDGVSGLLILTVSGNRVRYRSYYLDGRQSWDGEFLRRK